MFELLIKLVHDFLIVQGSAIPVSQLLLLGLNALVDSHFVAFLGILLTNQIGIPI